LITTFLLRFLTIYEVGGGEELADVVFIQRGLPITFCSYNWQGDGFLTHFFDMLDPFISFKGFQAGLMPSLSQYILGLIFRREELNLVGAVWRIEISLTNHFHELCDVNHSILSC
jgi:hypothetical protein